VLSYKQTNVLEHVFENTESAAFLRQKSDKNVKKSDKTSHLAVAFSEKLLYNPVSGTKSHKFPSK